METRVITLSGAVPAAIARVFPDAEPFGAVDTRSIDTASMLRRGMITAGGMEALRNGRKYHHELPGKGAVGLYHSVRAALEAGTGPLLLMEEDCLPSDKLPAVCAQLLEAPDEFDLAVFGPLRYDGKGVPSNVHSQFRRLVGYFWGTHAVLYSAEGRRRAAAALQGPVAMQIDGKLARLNQFTGLPSGPLRALIQTKGSALAAQSIHASGVQAGGCLICDVSPSKGIHPLIYFPLVHIAPVVSVAVFAGAGAVLGWITRRK